MQSVHRCDGFDYDLTAGTPTLILRPGSRRLCWILNPSDSVVRLLWTKDPWCLSFDAGDHVTVNGLATDAPLLAGATGIVRARVNITADANVKNIFSVSDASEDEYFGLWAAADETIVAKLQTAAGATRWSVTTDNAVDTGKWLDIKVKQDGVTPKIYINGGAVAQTLAGAAQTEWFPDLSNLDVARIGSLSISGAGEANQFNGKVDWLRIQVGLTLDPLAADGVARGTYFLDEGTGNPSDVSGAGNNGTLGAGAAAPAWAMNQDGMYLPANFVHIYDEAVVQLGLWGYTADSGVSLNVAEGR